MVHPTKNSLKYVEGYIPEMVNPPVSFAEKPKLNVPRLLLPYNSCIPSAFILTTKGGCYEWNTDRYDLVSLKPLVSEEEHISNCSRRAIISAVTTEAKRDNAIILAKDEKSGKILHCDVIIDIIYSIEIKTKTTILYLEDIPEMFEVTAKNKLGDTFSSLSGIAFDWKIKDYTNKSLDWFFTDTSSSDASKILRFLKFNDSAYMTRNVEFFEKQNLKSSKILIQGFRTGSAQVTVKPLDPAYKAIYSYKVQVLVVPNMTLKPSHIYLLPGSQFTLYLEIIKHGNNFSINLPSNQYELKIVDDNIASLHEGSTINALNYGSTNIVVKDKLDISGKQIAYLPSSTVHVTVPSYMTLSITPFNMWNLEEKKKYFISMEIYDTNSHPLRISQNVTVAIEFPSKYLKVIFSSINGTQHVVQAISPGSCKITGHLLAVRNKDGKLLNLSVSEDITVFKRISVTPAFIFLPWYPVEKTVHSICLEAAGGSGSYNWKSSDPSLASVHVENDCGVEKARLIAFGKGTFQVQVTDVNMPLFIGFAKVSVQPVQIMQILPFEVEVEVKKNIIIPLAMYGFLEDKKIKLFNNCSAVPIILKIDEIERVTQVTDKNEPVSPSACRNIYLKCLKSGISRIHIKYENEDFSFTKSILIGCYRRLQISNQSDAVIAIGSSLNRIIIGGPVGLPNCRRHITVTPEHRYVDIALLKNKSEPLDVHKVYAFCKKYGEKIFSLKIDSNCHDAQPASNNITFSITCGVPEKIVLRHVLPTIEGKKKCPSLEDKIGILCYQSQNIHFSVMDKGGRIFQNISSFNIQWYLSDNSVATLSDTYDPKSKNIQFHTDFMELNESKTIFELTASIVGYKTPYLKNVDIVNQKFTTPVNSSLKFRCLNEAEILPNNISLFNFPSNKIYLNITKGSGKFDVETNDSSKAIMVRISSRQIEITPLEVGALTITVTDLCLGIKHEGLAEIEIYGISAINVDVLDKVQIGQSIEARVEIFNENNEKIPSSTFGLMNLQAVAVSDVVSVKFSSLLESSQFHASFTITGFRLGHARIKVVTNSKLSQEEWESNTYPIQVFSPLKLSPDHIVLIVGATFQVVWSGGPQPQTDVEYSMDDKDTAAVSVSGVVEGKRVGKTMLYAKAVDHDTNGNTIVFSEDKAVVTVINLKEIRIHSPLSTMIVGTEMPLYATGITDEENPFAFGTALPTAKFTWTISNDKVASLYNLYEPIGLQETNDNHFRVSLKALQDGLVTIYVEVVLPSTFCGSQKILSSDIQIQVLQKLQMTNPDVEDKMIILSPNSELKLKCNRSTTAEVYYEITSDKSDNPVVSVDSEGNLIASSIIGYSSLVITSIDKLGVIQKLTTIVKVSDIEYIMMRPIKMLQTNDWLLSTLPVGYTVSFAVTYHDNVGLQFDAVCSQLKFRSSRMNIATVSLESTNSTLSVKLIKPGYSVLKIWDADINIPADFIHIIAGSAIQPSDIFLTVGDVICFQSSLLTKGTWTSSKNILLIHPVFGGAIALSSGSTTVKYSLLDGRSASTEVEIKEASYVSFKYNNVNYANKNFEYDPYIPIVIQNNETHRISNIIGNCGNSSLPVIQPKFKCILNMMQNNSEIFVSAPGFDIEKGYFCTIESSKSCKIDWPKSQLCLSVHLIGHKNVTYYCLIQ